MKNLLKFLGLSVLVSFIVLGCSNTSGDAVTLTPSSKTNVKTISLVATGDAGAIVFPTAGISKTIVADSLDAESLKYYLFTVNKIDPANSPSFGPLDFEATDASKPNVGTVPLTINDGYYEFHLYAAEAAQATPLNENTVKDNSVFWGKTEADLRSADDKVSFYLTSDGLTGSADVALKLMTTGWTVPVIDPAYTIKAAVTNKKTGEVVGADDWKNVDNFSDSEPDNPNFTLSAVTAGTYNFEVKFTNPGSTKEYVWSDTIIIAQNHNIAKTIKIPEVIDLPPVAPTAFNATFKDPDTISAGSYNVEFTWAAAGTYNESYFKIQLLTIPEGCAWNTIDADTTKEWDDTYRGAMGNTGPTYITTIDKDFYGDTSKGWVDGSMRKNNNMVVVSLPLEARYLARICATNDAGDSAWKYIEFANSDVPESVTGGYAKFYADSKCINRYRLTYNLVGGTIDIDGTATSTKDIVEYRTQNTAANPGAGVPGNPPTAGTYKGASVASETDVPTADIWNPSCDTTTYKSLKQGTKEWTSWRLNSSDSTTLYDATTPTSPYNPPDYTSFKNLVLFASYSPTTAGVTIHDDNDWTISVGNLAVTGTGVDPSKLTSQSEITLNLATSGAGDIAWTGTYTADQTTRGVKWTKVTYTIKKSGETFNKAGPVVCPVSSTGFSATTTPMKSYQEGKYLVTFNAYTANKTEPYTCTVVVIIKRQ